MEWYTKVNGTGLTFTGTEGWQHVVVLFVCVFHDHTITTKPYCALYDLNTLNNAPYYGDNVAKKYATPLQG